MYDITLGIPSFSTRNFSIGLGNGGRYEITVSALFVLGVLPAGKLLSVGVMVVPDHRGYGGSMAAPLTQAVAPICRVPFFRTYESTISKRISIRRHGCPSCVENQVGNGIVERKRLA